MRLISYTLSQGHHYRYKIQAEALTNNGNVYIRQYIIKWDIDNKISIKVHDNVHVQVQSAVWVKSEHHIQDSIVKKLYKILSK